MTKEEWEEACGFHDKEEYLVRAIKRHLLTEYQKNVLINHDLSVEDVLNGRWPMDLEDVISIILEEWNQTLGWHEFGF